MHWKIRVQGRGASIISQRTVQESILFRRKIHSGNGKRHEGLRNDRPWKAHVYFLPFSVVMMVQYLHVQGSRDIHPIGRTIADYVDTISRKYGFWNRSSGADHFMLPCHDWVSHNLKEMIKKKDTVRTLCSLITWIHDKTKVWSYL